MCIRDRPRLIQRRREAFRKLRTANIECDIYYVSNNTKRSCRGCWNKGFINMFGTQPEETKETVLRLIQSA